MNQREILKSKIVQLLRIEEEGPDRDESIEQAFEEILEFVPNAEVRQLLYFPHWDMTADDIVEELEVRQGVFAKSGEAGIHSRLLDQVIEALEDPERSLGHKNSAYEILRYHDAERAACYRQEIDRLHADLVRKL